MLQEGVSDAAALPGSQPTEPLVATWRRLRSAQKPPAKGSPAYSRFVNRRLGRFLAAAAYRLSLTPDQVSLISAAFTATGIALVALVRPAPLTGVAVSLLLAVGYAFDSADGQLARLRGGGRPAGEWLDHVLDAVKTSALHLAVLVAWYRFYELRGPALLVPIGYTLVAAVHFFATWITDQMRRAHPAVAPAAGATGPGLLRSLLVLPTDYGLLLLTFVLLAWQPGFITVYTLLFAGTALFLLAALPKWFREVSRFPSP
jgi:phosphatidylglycerophosphate synthase